MRIAELQRGLCVNVIEASDFDIIKGLPQFTDSELVEIPDEFGVGDTYINGKWDSKSVVETPTDMKVKELEIANTQLKNELGITQAVVDELLSGGAL